MKNSTKKQKRQTSRRAKWTAIAVIISAVGVAAAVWYMSHKELALGQDGPVSRQVLLVQEEIIKQVKPPPTMSALQYAYTTSAYNDALVETDQSGALGAAKAMLTILYPDSRQQVVTQIDNIAQKNHLTVDDNSAIIITKHYQQRYEHDGHDLAWDGIIPKGKGKWTKTTAKDPFTPRAGDWQRWNVSQAIVVPEPPVYGSAEDLKQIEIVKQASATRNGEDVNQINFWGGTPGTAAPSGIWQNQLFATVNKDLPQEAFAADRSYALIQKTLAQTISDAFMECWKVKYTYWTARPSMRIPSLVTAMDNPVFPSYISGHSTISKAAADVLSVQVPKYHDNWESMAMQARNSRLKAGIHFEIDNAVGFDVGTEVGRQTNTKLHLHQIL